MSKTTLLVDGDLVVYRAAAAAQTSVEFEPGQWSYSCDEDEARQRVDSELGHFKRHLKADAMLVMFSDSGNNWRRELCPSYKAQRGAKPAAYSSVREYVEETYRCVSLPRLEADDVMGLYSTGKKVEGDKIIVSSDKDMRTIPGLLFNPGHEEDGVVRISREEADYAHAMQTLTGDRVDGFAGLPGCGPKKAEKILAGLKQSEWWGAIVKAYATKDLTEEHALLQARLARILRNGEYVLKTKEIKLWTPK